MSIMRQEVVDPSDGRPCISGGVVRGNTVDVRGETADPVGDIRTQTRQVLQRIDNYLARGGTDKSKLLTAQVWLADFRLFDDMNAVWDEWVDQDNPPVLLLATRGHTATGPWGGASRSQTCHQQILTWRLCHIPPAGAAGSRAAPRIGPAAPAWTMMAKPRSARSVASMSRGKSSFAPSHWPMRRNSRTML